MTTQDIIKYINTRRNKQYMKNQTDIDCISTTIHGVNYFDVSEVVGKRLFDSLILNKKYNFWHFNQIGNDLANSLMISTGISSGTLRNWIFKYQNVYVNKKHRKLERYNTIFFNI